MFDSDSPSMARRDFLKLAGVMGGAALAMNSNLLANAAKKKAANPQAIKKTKAAKVETEKPSVLAQNLLAYDETGGIVAHTFENLTNVEGLSQNQLNQHVGLYQGYVKKINEIQSQINSLSPDQANMNATYNPYRELYVEQSFALNGVVLHEHYFENIGGQKLPASENLKNMIRKEFGNWDNYLNHLVALAKSARGWVITGYNMRDYRIHNYMLDAHNQLVPFHVLPLLVLDVYEHAYMIDYGTKRPLYIEAFLKNVNWNVVEERLETALLNANKRVIHEPS